MKKICLFTLPALLTLGCFENYQPECDSGSDDNSQECLYKGYASYFLDPGSKDANTDLMKFNLSGKELNFKCDEKGCTCEDGTKCDNDGEPCECKGACDGICDDHQKCIVNLKNENQRFYCGIECGEGENQYCDADTDKCDNKICVPKAEDETNTDEKKKEGEDCDDNNPCDSGLVCEDSKCTKESTDNPDCPDGNCQTEPESKCNPACTGDLVCNEFGDCETSAEFDLRYFMFDKQNKEIDEAGSKVIAIPIMLKKSANPNSGVTLECEVIFKNARAEDDKVEILCDNGKNGNLEFSSGKYDEAQVIIVKSKGNDNLIHGDREFSIKITSKSTSTDFNGLTRTIDGFKLVETDVADIAFSANTLMTSKNDSNADACESNDCGSSFDVSLTSIPSAEVTVTCKSSSDKLGKVYTEAGEQSDISLKFDKDTWQTPQKVNLKGVDANTSYTKPEDMMYQISCSTASDDSNYKSVKPKTVDVGNMANDDKCVVVPPSITIDEDSIKDIVIGKDKNVELKSIEFKTENTNIEILDAQATPVTSITDNITWTDGKTFAYTTLKLKAKDDGTTDSGKKIDIPISITYKDESTDEKKITVNTKNITDAGIYFDKKGSSLENCFNDGEFCFFDAKKSTSSSVDILIRLKSVPKSEVTVEIKSDPVNGKPDLLKIAQKINTPTTLTFTPDNWSEPQKVNVGYAVSPVIGHVGVGHYNLVMTTSSSDKIYGNIEFKIPFIVFDY